MDFSCLPRRGTARRVERRERPRSRVAIGAGHAALQSHGSHSNTLTHADGESGRIGRDRWPICEATASACANSTLKAAVALAATLSWVVHS